MNGMADSLFKFNSWTQVKGEEKILRIVQLAVILVFLGRAWQHLFWDAPFRTVLWDEKWMSGIVKLTLGMEWTDFATSPSVEQSIQVLIRCTGGLYLACTMAAIFVRSLTRWLSSVLLLAGAASMFFLAVCYMKVAFFSVGQLLEYALQVTAPVFFFLLAVRGVPFSRISLSVKIAAAATFTCHGLYAIGYYPVPGPFLQMVIQILGLTEQGARTFLLTAGVLDFVVSIAIFLPSRVANLALAYMVLWGLATTAARLLANFHLDFWLDSLHFWLPEVIFRAPHFLIPAAVLLASRTRPRD
jgi:hypothetical protein